MRDINRFSVRLAYLILNALLFAALPVSCAGAVPGDGGRDTAVSFLNIPESTEQFGILEADIDVKAPVKNPFDTDESDIKAYIKGPDNTTAVVRAFYYQDFVVNRIKPDDVLEPKGPPVWKLRFAPALPGDYMVYVIARINGREARTEERKFNVRPSAEKGFIRSSGGTSYLKYDSGDTFFGIGENVAWANGVGKKDHVDLKEFDGYLAKLSSNGANLIRTWMSWWSFGIEWTPLGTNGYNGIGRYSLQNSWRLDHALNEAKSKGISMIIVFDSYFVLMNEKGFWGEEQWARNPYNATRGGPCKMPADFWTDPSARSAYKKRLDYIIARWGSYTNLMAFELWNEMNAPAAWVDEMSQYIKRADPYGHLITISLGELSFDGFSEEAVWKLPAIDFTQAHIYGAGPDPVDLIDRIFYKSENQKRLYGKPFLVGEYGIDWSKSDAIYDKDGRGIHIHNCLWAGLFSGSMSGAMNWWWDSYVNKKDLYGIYGPFSAFIKELKFPKDGWSMARCRVSTGGPDAPSGEKVSLQTIDEWGAKDERAIEILNDGSVRGGRLNKYLHASNNKKGLSMSPVFKVDYPRPGEFVVKIGIVSISSVLNVYIDGRRVFSRRFPGKDSSGRDDWKQKTYRRMWNIYQYEYDTSIAISVPEGRHTISMENADGDWLSIDNISLTNYKMSAGADLRAFGMKSRDGSIFWIQNRRSDWHEAYKGNAVNETKGAVLEVHDMPDGLYEIEWYDTWAGRMISKEEKTASGGSLFISIPAFTRDIACKVKKFQ